MTINQNAGLDDWTPTVVAQMLERDEGEGLVFDFKEVLNSREPQHNHNIRKAATSFANTSGGFLVFGIRDKSRASGWARLVGVSDTTNFAKELTNKLSGNEVVPHMFFEGPKIIALEHGGVRHDVAVVRIGESELKPHGISKDGGPLEFWMRGNASAVPASYPGIVKMMQDSAEVRNWLAALYLDTEYVDAFADQMVIGESDRQSSIPVVRINALVNGDQSSQVVARIPTDVELIRHIWALRANIDMANSFRDMMIQLQATALSNRADLMGQYNGRVASLVGDIKRTTKVIRSHLTQRYAGVREWISVVQRPS